MAEQITKEVALSEVYEAGQLSVVKKTPHEVVVDAAKAAKELKNIVDNKPKKVMINGEQYLEYEDWQTVAKFFLCSVKTTDPLPVTFNNVDGFTARSEVIDNRTGMVIGGATAYCMRDEPNWKDKPLFQLASMAQTRAGAKGLRNCFAWVVVLAGYKPTPAEEMDGISPSIEDVCPIHGETWVKFSKKGAVWYSHKMADGKYCNKGDVETRWGNLCKLAMSKANLDAESDTAPLIHGLGIEKETTAELTSQEKYAFYTKLADIAAES